MKLYPIGATVTHLANYSMITVAYDRNDMYGVEKAVKYFDSKKTDYFWRELYDTWSFPVTYKFDFTDEEDLMLCRLFVGGKRVNLGLTKETN